MGFQEITSVMPLVVAFILSVSLVIFVPNKFDTRSFLLAVSYYAFFIPSFIILASTDLEPAYFLALTTSFGLLFLLSSLKISTFDVNRMSRKSFFFAILALLYLSVVLLAAYGGLTNFNLNILRVYEFRREASGGMPALFGYVFSGVSKVVAPMSLALAIYFRSKLFFVLSSVSIILLFGMTSHKSVLLLPMFVVAFFLALKNARNIRIVLYLFLMVGFLSAVEAAYISTTDLTRLGYFNTLIIRRAFFTPPLLDSLYVNFFSGAEKLYWSTSKFGLGLSDNPYDLAAPFLIGREFFGRDEMSANTGIIGSGFSHAGYIGIVLYASLAGFLLAFLQAYGRIVGHALISAASLSVFMSIVTSTDFATAILTHGLLLLIALLLVFPKTNDQRSQPARNANDNSFHHSSPSS